MQLQHCRPLHVRPLRWRDARFSSRELWKGLQYHPIRKYLIENIQIQQNKCDFKWKLQVQLAFIECQKYWQRNILIQILKPSLRVSNNLPKDQVKSYHLYNLKMHHLFSGVQNWNARWTDSADSQGLAHCCCCCWHLLLLSAVSGSGLHQPPTTTSQNPVSGPVWRSHSPQTRQGFPPIRALETRNWPMRDETTKNLVYHESSQFCQ